MFGWIFVLLGLIAVFFIFAYVSLASLAKTFFLANFTRYEKGEEREDTVVDAMAEEHGERMDAVIEGREFIRSLSFEEVTIKSKDGLTLYARLYVNPDPCGRTVLMMHGFRSSPTLDMAGGFPHFYKQGYHILLPDERAHGKSEGAYITFGVNEQDDTARWASYLSGRFPDMPLVLFGISMGATAVLLSAGNCVLPPNVRCVVADCGFTSPYDEFNFVVRTRTSAPTKILLYLTDKYCRRHAGFGFRDASTVDAMEKCKYPVLFIHGRADDLVPIACSEAASQACAAPHETFFVEKAHHAESFLYDREGYLSHVDAFIEKYISAD